MFLVNKIISLKKQLIYLSLDHKKNPSTYYNVIENKIIYVFLYNERYNHVYEDLMYVFI